MTTLQMDALDGFLAHSVWAAFHSDRSAIAFFDSELEARRYAMDAGMECVSLLKRGRFMWGES